VAPTIAAVAYPSEASAPTTAAIACPAGAAALTPPLLLKKCFGFDFESLYGFFWDFIWVYQESNKELSRTL
jgi:predicted lactoylglutathione lyase